MLASFHAAIRTTSRRAFSTSLKASDPLKDRFAAVLAEKQKVVKELRTTHANVKLGDVTIGAAIGGARSVKCMLWEPSLLDAEEGIRFRGYTIPEVQKKLQKAPGGSEPIPEALLWLLLTGELPTDAQTQFVVKELQKRGELPVFVTSLLAGLPVDMHPMTKFSIAVLALQKDSLFAKAYADGVNKSLYWDSTYEDMLNLVAKLPSIAAQIYRDTYHGQKRIKRDPTHDWGKSLARMLGFNSAEFDDLMRLYLVIHSDHEGGNVSAHATHLVGSALSDPYLSLSAGLNGLAGPLHGLANQEVLRWTVKLIEKVGENCTAEQLEKALWDTLNSGQVVPGFGHAVLRKTDPRYTCQREFALRHLPNDPLFKLVSLMYEVAPRVLTEHGKTANPWPNVDAHSGVLLHHYGLKEDNFYTVLFGASRAIGVLAQQVWARGLGLPIERPKSLTSDWMINFVKSQQTKAA